MIKQFGQVLMLLAIIVNAIAIVNMIDMSSPITTGLLIVALLLITLIGEHSGLETRQ